MIGGNTSCEGFNRPKGFSESLGSQLVAAEIDFADEKFQIKKE